MKPIKMHPSILLPQNIATKIHHIALIADGNRRWARENNLHLSEGHRIGFTQTTPALLTHIWNIGIHTTTLWACSVRNLENRNPEEITALLSYLKEMVEKILPLAQMYKVKIIHLGRKNRLPDDLLKTIQQAEGSTAHFESYVVNLAIDYNGRDEIIRAVNSLLTENKKINHISDDLLATKLDTKNQLYSDPDLIIRGADEKRLSGFMSWQNLYSELYFTSTRYPAFTSQTIDKAILNYLQRKRTFSK